MSVPADFLGWISMPVQCWGRWLLRADGNTAPFLCFFVCGSILKVSLDPWWLLGLPPPVTLILWAEGRKCGVKRQNSSSQLYQVQFMYAKKKSDVPTGQHPETRAVPENNGNRQHLKKSPKRHVEHNLVDCRLDKHPISRLGSSGTLTFTMTELTLVWVGPVQEPVFKSMAS